jgi:cysteine sulfinate desulfinase/cysteine desulfurase-like protein
MRIQALGKIPFDIKSMKADLVTLSAHKIGGPKGVGALVLADEAQGLEPLLRGGGQELGRRAWHRECRGHRGVRRCRPGRHDGLGRRCSPATGPAEPS